MNRRDILMILGILICAIYNILIMPSVAQNWTSNQLIANFAISIFVLDLYLLALLITSTVISKFRKWCNTKIWRS